MTNQKFKFRYYKDGHWFEVRCNQKTVATAMKYGDIYRAYLAFEECEYNVAEYTMELTLHLIKLKLVALGADINIMDWELIDINEIEGNNIKNGHYTI